MRRRVALVDASGRAGARAHCGFWMKAGSEGVVAGAQGARKGAPGGGRVRVAVGRPSGAG